MFVKLLAEFIGTFFLVFAFLLFPEAIFIAIIIGATVFFAGHIGGGHMNPAVSAALMVNGDINILECIFYISVQLLGGFAALMLIKFIRSRT